MRVEILEWWAKVNETTHKPEMHHGKCDFYLAAFHLPLRMRSDFDGSRGPANVNNTMHKLSTGSDSVDMVSDEFDSDSKENENVSENDEFHG